MRRGRNMGRWGTESGTNTTTDRHIERAVLDSEIGDLEDLTGYFKVPGYTLRLQFVPIPPRILHPVTILRSTPDYSVPPMTQVTAERNQRKRKATGQTQLFDGPSETADPVDNRRGVRQGERSGDTYSTAGAKQ